MKNLLIKELRLPTSILSWLFLAFAAMTLIPGYPILLGSFFVCLGIFQSFQTIRENNDVLYTVLLPVERRTPSGRSTSWCASWRSSRG